MKESIIKLSGSDIAGKRENLDMLPTTPEELSRAMVNRESLAKAASESSRSILDHIKRIENPLQFDAIDLSGDPIKVAISRYPEADDVARIQIYDEFGSQTEEYSFWPNNWGNTRHNKSMAVSMSPVQPMGGSINSINPNNRFGKFPEVGVSYGKSETYVEDYGSEEYLQVAILLLEGAAILDQAETRAIVA